MTTLIGTLAWWPRCVALLAFSTGAALAGAAIAAPSAFAIDPPYGTPIAVAQQTLPLGPGPYNGSLAVPFQL
jgi:hypothetical protein